MWSAEITCAVLYVASLKTLLDATLNRRGSWTDVAALALCWLVFALHVESGIVMWQRHFAELPFD